MKKNAFTNLVFIVFAVLALYSCSKDDTNIEKTTSTGDYFPTAINNSWVLNTNESLSTMKITGTDSFDGKEYFKFDQFIGSEGLLNSWLRKSNGNYYFRIGELTFNYEGLTATQTGYEYIFFKDYLDVNQTWTGTYTQKTTYTGFPPITTTVNYTGTILEKNTTLTLNEKTYNDVIKFRYNIKVIDPKGSEMQSYNFDYWIAKNVGIIKFIGAGSMVTLDSYNLN